MFKKHSRDIRFLFNAAALALIVMAVLQAIQPYLAGPDPQAAQIEAFTYKIVPIPAQAVPPLLHKPDGRPVMLVVYASWCPYCRVMMPDIAHLMAEGEMDGVETVFLSRDQEIRPLAAYLIHQHYDALFTPYILSTGPLPQLLQSMGSHFSGKIPYLAFFDGRGKLVAEFLGQADEPALRAALERVKTRGL
ncbi:MAG: redoxin family protein [Pseudomonadota bacterium]|nr:redoxin family protein [Pseudomonadota bacterium]